MYKNPTGRSIGQSFDWKLVLMYLLLIFIGWINVYASIHADGSEGILDWGTRSGKQFVWIMTSLGLAALILFVIPPRIWESASVPLYLVALGLLVAVIFLGVDVKGSRSWFEFGPVRFQPAEISKITTSLVLAAYMSRSSFKMSRAGDFLLMATIILIPMAVILGESETGSALVYIGFVFMLYREGLSGWLLVAIGMAILLFILTLKDSSYTAMTVLLAVLLVCNSARAKRVFPAMTVSALTVLALAFLPSLMMAATEHFTPGASVLDSVDASVAGSIRAAGRMTWMIAVKPVYILSVLAACAIPWVLVKSYHAKNGFAAFSVAAFLLGAALSFSTDFIFNDVLQDHQRKRIEVLLGMKEDLSGVGYNVHQSMIAIGSGGLFGKGFLNGTQTTFGFVPEQSTDFIFCTVGEEWGFAGCLVVILLYVGMIWRLVRDAESCRGRFSRIYGYCVAGCIFMHLFINVGMTIGLMPVIGIPLPFMSYGGSSLWAFTILLFIFIALYHEEKKYF
jgi:rod shape determining protein RodA